MYCIYNIIIRHNCKYIHIDCYLYIHHLYDNANDYHTLYLFMSKIKEIKQ